MVLSRFSPSRSLSVRFILGFGVMLVPLLVVSLVALLSMNQAIATLDEVAKKSADQGMVSLGAQVAMLETQTALANYIVEPVAAKARLAAALESADQALLRLDNIQFDGPEEQNIIDQVRSEWRWARVMGQEVVLIPLSGLNDARKRDFENRIVKTNALLVGLISGLDKDIAVGRLRVAAAPRRVNHRGHVFIGAGDGADRRFAAGSCCFATSGRR